MGYTMVSMSVSDLRAGEAENCLLNLMRRIDSDDRGASVEIDRAAYLAEFLDLCARSLTAEPGSGDERYSTEFYQARDVFVRAGLEALTAPSSQPRNDWLQIGIRPRDRLGMYGDLCQHISSFARRVLNDSLADNFFFMNKPPGMRLRFQAAATTSSADLANVVNAEAMRWQAAGLIDHIEHGVYEPETRLFCGPRSMSFVHALFTVDSLIWLDYHACRAVEGEAINPAWLVSLAALRTIFAGLQIVGWEDLGVWDCIRDMAGRQLGQDKASLPLYGAVSDELRNAWSRRDRILEDLHPAVRAIVAHHDSALLTGAAQWRTGYFCQRGASLGPRAAAAFYVIFHWNRAGLSPTEQALLAESLSERILDDVRG